MWKFQKIQKAVVAEEVMTKEEDEAKTGDEVKEEMVSHFKVAADDPVKRGVREEMAFIS